MRTDHRLRNGLALAVLALSAVACSDDTPSARDDTTGVSFSTGQDADLTLSAVGFDDAGGSLLFNHPGAVATDGTRLFLADRNNNRVLIWNTLPTGNEEPDIVLGQPDMNANDPGDGPQDMNWPVALSVGGGVLAVADTENDRVLLWTSEIVSSGQPADLVLTGAAEQTVEWPWGVWTDGQRLAVVNTPRHEALLWDDLPTASDTPADVRLTGDGRFGTPRSITSDGQHLLIGDHNASAQPLSQGAPLKVQNGTYVWEQWPTTDAAPDALLDGWLQGEITDDGQLLTVSTTDLTLSLWNEVPTDGREPDLTVGGTGGFEFFAGDGSDIAIAGEMVFVSLSNGNRIVGYDHVPTSADDVPQFAIGAPDVDTNTLTTQSIISNPDPVTDGTSLFVLSDFDRTLSVWETIPTASGTPPDHQIAIDEPPAGIALAGDQLVVRTRTGLLVWDGLPVDGRRHDREIPFGDPGPQGSGGFAYDGTHFAVSDTDAGTITVWQGLPASFEAEPLVVLQTDRPGALSSDGTHLAVLLADGRNVGVYELAGLTASAEPSLVANPGGRVESSGSAPGAFDRAGGVLVAGGRLFVADTNTNRVLVWDDVVAAVAGDPFAALIGDDDVADDRAEIGVDRLFWPRELAFDGERLWVGEFKFSERLVMFSAR